MKEFKSDLVKNVLPELIESSVAREDIAESCFVLKQTWLDDLSQGRSWSE